MGLKEAGPVTPPAAEWGYVSGYAPDYEWVCAWERLHLHPLDQSLNVRKNRQPAEGSLKNATEN